MRRAAVPQVKPDGAASGLLLRIFVPVLLLCLAACDFGGSAARIAYWQNETRQKLPIGTRKNAAEIFFRDRGLELRCCISGPEMQDSHLAREDDIGRELITQYGAMIVVDFKDEQVARVRVLRVGAGL